jgi:hypothetical protein
MLSLIGDRMLHDTSEMLESLILVVWGYLDWTFLGKET